MGTFPEATASTSILLVGVGDYGGEAVGEDASMALTGVYYSALY